ncbi:UrcA family protein [Sphingomonas sp.]|uniref:UrcA family protein n=1 Tax=Sphingomonas sp. TaxID=28214 RepID=UPI001EB76D61|nr:UrcA family protein [Sphingomonas sp.]MBX3594266.1 UrcA family protein [Sphingomonas sp.]
MIVRNLLALLGLATVALGTAAALFAGGYDPYYERPRALAVSFAGLDLATPEGLAILDRRIERAVDKVCGRTDRRNLRLRSVELRCRRDAWLAVEPQVAAAVDRAERRNRLAWERDRELGGYGPPPVAEAGPPPPRPAPPSPPPVVFAPRSEVVQALPADYYSRRRR